MVTWQVLTLLLETPTDDSVEVACSFVTECGAMLAELTPQGLNAIFERLRGVLHEGAIDKRVQYMIEVRARPPLLTTPWCPSLLMIEVRARPHHPMPLPLGPLIPPRSH